MNSSIVEERVYLSPWEDGATRPQSSPEGLAAQTADSTQDTEGKDTQPQIAMAESAAGLEAINEFFSQPGEPDAAQFATEVELEPEAIRALLPTPLLY